MYVDPDVTITTILVWLREIAIIIGIVVFGWKARDVFQSFIDFKNDITDFMKDMRSFAERMETNHFAHMERYLKVMAGSSGQFRERVYEDSEIVRALEKDDAPKI